MGAFSCFYEAANAGTLIDVILRISMSALNYSVSYTESDHPNTN
jgi:hypothetical protein